MTRMIYLTPSEQGVGITSVCKGIVYSLERQGYAVASFNPLRDITLTADQVRAYFDKDEQDELIEYLLRIIDKDFNQDILIVQGLYTHKDLDHPYAWMNAYVDWFNDALSRALNAQMILVCSHQHRNEVELNEHIHLLSKKWQKNQIIGIMLTMLNAPCDTSTSFSLLDESLDVIHPLSKEKVKTLDVFKSGMIKLLGLTEWSKSLLEPRIKDLEGFANYHIIVKGDLNRRIKRISMCSRFITTLLEDFQPGTLIVTCAERSDVIIAACLAAQKGIKLAGLMLTVEDYLDPKVSDFCFDIAGKCGLPIISTPSKSVKTILELSQLDFNGIPHDDTERQLMVKEHIANHIELQSVLDRISIEQKHTMSPPAFRYYLIKQAQASKRRIVLPESYEPRTLQAAVSCHHRNIADCVLIGNRTEIEKVAQLNGFKIPQTIDIIDPKANFERYLSALLEARKSKGLSEPMARDLLEKPMFLATIMLHLGEVDGIVSGAEQTTAETVRPPLQIIKTKPNCRLVSSVFFMCMEDQVLVYGDCAINQDPNAEQLADIAIESAISAQQFGIEPRIAMISYSTGNSGSGEDVEKVKTATEIVKQKRPDLLVDGPLQYDAAMIESVAKKKAPNSPVAGKATVLVFPDLNTGNTVYKAVQRSANVLSIGPMLQGMNKPVNDLSRGATIDDIIYTIAITAIQAQ